MDTNTQVPGGGAGRIANNPETGIAASPGGAMSTKDYEEKLKNTRISKYESVKKSFEKRLAAVYFPDFTCHLSLCFSVSANDR
ncbi:MAG: hypothetical protein U5K84_12365 [Alkalibacterium sp.]|nr:hypothetical protein [Alkalibacterium sp.]